MVFSSFAFVSVFFPLTYFINRCLPIRFSNVFLLLVSLLLYAWGEPVYVLLLIGCALANYVIALIAPAHRKLALGLALTFNLGVLCLYKYTNFLIENLNVLLQISIPKTSIRMPLGISFFTFQAMSYTIDVCRGECTPQRSFSKLLLYIALFPQLIAGPIVKYHEIEAELTQRSANVSDTVCGARRFCFGLGKKVLLANALAVTADAIFGADMALLSLPTAWLGALCYALQIYFDFSGYTDMAIGMGRMMGFHFPENFNFPYAAHSMQDFWRRWHISLSSWFRDYVYIPLGGNRRGQARAVLNRSIVFFLTGLWHGASWNFVLWGMGNGLLLMLESCGVLPVQKLKGRLRPIGHIYVLLSVLLLFVLFRAETLSQAVCFWRSMFSCFDITQAQRLLLAQNLTGSTIITLLAAAVCAMPWTRWINCPKHYTVLQSLSCAAGLAVLWLSLASLASQSYNPFIYFRF